MARAWRLELVVIIGALVASGCGSERSEGAGPTDGAASATTVGAQAGEPAVVRKTAVPPKPLSPVVVKGLKWLAAGQQPDGGFGQGEESVQMRGSVAPGAAEPMRDRSNVADTCMAALALLRSGSTPAEGPYAEAIRRAAEFVCSQVEAAPAEGLSVTEIRGTRVQAKIGTYIDTFLAAQLLAELKDRMGSPEADQRLLAALDKVVDKIEKQQREDGTWNNQGWATVLCQSIAGRGLNRAINAGFTVDEKVIYRMETLAKSAFSPGGSAAGGSTPSTAGVALYAESANLGILQEGVNAATKRSEALNEIVTAGPATDQAAEARQQLAGLEESKTMFDAAQGRVIDRLDEPSFVAGFGSNGGEEFLSYMNISESLVLKADESWKRWDSAMAENLGRVQNADGSWSGHHCITGRTFCTAAALMVLMTDRMEIPAEAARAN